MPKNQKKKPICDAFEAVIDIEDSAVETPKGLFVTIDATHGGYINRNWYYYVPTEMSQSVNTWISPYRKPAIKNHDSKQDPLGRVHTAEYIGNENEGFIQLGVLITDEDAIKKIQDERYLTVSTSGNPAGYVKCSVCDTDLTMSDEFCGHRRGDVYTVEDASGNSRDVQCFWKIGRLNYQEVSFVTKPADSTDTRAAVVTGWKFNDEEEDIKVNLNDDKKHKVTGKMVSESTKGILLTDGPEEEETEEFIPVNDDEYAALMVLDDNDIEVFCDRDKFETIREKLPKADYLDCMRAYVRDSGRFTVDPSAFLSIDDNDVWIPNADDVKLLKWLNDNVVRMTLKDKEVRKLTDYAIDEKSGRRHRHVVYMNEANNGHSDYLLDHSHDIIDGEMQPTRSYDYDKDEEVYGIHIHEIVDKVLPEDDLKFLDAPQSERSKKNLSKKSPEKFCGPMDPRKGRKSFPVRNCAQARTAMRLLPKYKGPGNKSRIKSCIRRMAKNMGCPFSDQLERLSELAAIMEKVV